MVDFIGEDGSLVVLDPLKPQKDGRKVFQFNCVFGPTATQGNKHKLLIFYSNSEVSTFCFSLIVTITFCRGDI